MTTMASSAASGKNAGMLPHEDSITIPAVQLTIGQIEPVTAVWWQTHASDDAAAACVEAVMDMPCIADPEMLAFTDVTLLVSDNKTGLRCVQMLQDRGVDVAHTFGETKQRQHDRKLGFYMGDGRVKATTIHSFKGWETRALVLCISHAPDETSLKAAYTGLTRLNRHPQGSFLTVVCAAPELAEFRSHNADVSRASRSVTPVDEDVSF